MILKYGNMQHRRGKSPIKASARAEQPMDLDRNFMTWQRKHMRSEGYQLKLHTTEKSFSVPGLIP